MKYTKAIGRSLLALLPQAKAVAQDKDGTLWWYNKTPKNKDPGNRWWAVGKVGYLGNYDLPKDWCKTLVIKKGNDKK